jgi:hypothetical protein
MRFSDFSDPKYLLRCSTAIFVEPGDLDSGTAKSKTYRNFIIFVDSKPPEESTGMAVAHDAKLPVKS